MEPAARRSAARRSVRALARALEGVDEAIWVLNSQYELLYINGAAAAWLQIDAEGALGKKCHAAIPRGSRWDDVAAALAPPLGLQDATTLVALAEPPHAPPRSVRYSTLGSGQNQIIVAVSGAQEAAVQSDDLALARQLRTRLNHWRRQSVAAGVIAAAGSSFQANRLRQQILLAQATRQPIGIIGPRGCGSEAIARRIHVGSAPSAIDADPLITVDTPLMDAELLDATLSPAAAHLSARPQATVTVVLRGVDESPLDVQQRILDFAAEHAGAVRLIGLLASPLAGQGDPAALTPQMALALSVLEIVIAPLAQRCEDIPLIASALVDQRHASGASLAERISRSAQDRLLLYPWPGNYEELEATIRHACTACRTASIGPDDLPLAVRSFRLHVPKQKRIIAEATLDEAMKNFEINRIQEALELAGGNRTEAARLLGISRGRLLRRLDEQAAAQAPAQEKPPGEPRES